MGHVVLRRGTKLDVLFRLRQYKDGPLTDDSHWVDGTTSAEWPAVVFLNSSNVDVTSSFVKDLTAESVAPSTKHPTPSTGIAREAQGEYFVRTEPSNALSLGSGYKMKVTADLGGTPYIEEHTVTLEAAGDIEVGDEAIYATAAHVKTNFELKDAVTEDQIRDALVTADRIINSRLRMKGIPTPQERTDAFILAAVAFARGELRRLVAGLPGAGPGLGVKAVVEGDTRFEFQTGDGQYKALYDEGLRWLDMAITEVLGEVYFSASGHTNKPGGVY